MANADHGVLLVDKGAREQLALGRHARALEGRERDHGGGEPAACMSAAPRP